jgi:phosphatidylserine decarboxylase
MATGLTIILALGVVAAAAWAYWRFIWFWRNPTRVSPPGDDILSPADGTVVYVKQLDPHEPVISCKQGVKASVNDIAQTELGDPKTLIGIFMSPFGVHHNRAPINGVMASTVQYPGKQRRNHQMGSMYFRTIIGKHPMYVNSPHIIENNRAVTCFRGDVAGEPTACYVVQIGGGGISGIDVYPQPGEAVERGSVFGMIRIGSQVDLILPQRADWQVCVKPGDVVRAGETIVVRVSR